MPTPTPRFEKRADLYNAMADERAQRVSDAWDQRPPNTVQPSPQDVHAAWHFSPSPNPQQDFWNVHDQSLQQALLQAGPNPAPEDVQAAYKQAELTALQQVYPYRLMVAPIVGVTVSTVVPVVSTVLVSAADPTVSFRSIFSDWLMSSEI